jgi:hypothetical protein
MEKDSSDDEENAEVEDMEFDDAIPTSVLPVLLLMNVISRHEMISSRHSSHAAHSPLPVKLMRKTCVTGRRKRA